MVYPYMDVKHCVATLVNDLSSSTVLLVDHYTENDSVKLFLIPLNVNVYKGVEYIHFVYDVIVVCSDERGEIILKHFYK